ncbi:RNA-binding protein 42 [Entomophthora muscae]|uniref:RNA-binding protein 42 n=1 Tax=Entomophthora muscae TaxID=34485 RepID=A0ACC2SYA5_9FUNG|nr:RNA-binding protein 42 [Entomophthora muscae]
MSQNQHPGAPGYNPYYGTGYSGEAYYDPKQAFPGSTHSTNTSSTPNFVFPLGYDQGAYIKPDEQKSERKARKKKTLRTAAGRVWEDTTLTDWDQNDFRLFAGDLGNEVNDDTLRRAFDKYPGFIKAKVVRDKRTDKSKGYGFISFSDAGDFVKAWKEMNGKYVGNRPIKLRKSTWKERSVDPKILRGKKL